MISAQKLTKKFGKITALSDFTFKVLPGEFVFLTGPSGSGKTTFLKLILRELVADSGSLAVDGQEVSKIKKAKLPFFRRQIGVVFQDFKLLPDRDVWENVSLPMEVRGLKPAAIASAVKESLQAVGLTDRARLFPAQLSGGELQRIALARAIVGRPKIILADEPTGNLDPKTAKSIVKLLSTLHSELKTTVLMATHNAEIVNMLSLRVISLDDGRLVKDSPKGKYE